MRLGVIYEDIENAEYRAIEPMKAMERRGHEVVWPADPKRPADPRALSGCEMVHVYRRFIDRRVVGDLARAGILATYDNDDDWTTIPKQSRLYKEMRGFRGHLYFAESMKLARIAHICTTTSDLLARKIRKAGVERVEVIPNQLSPSMRRPNKRHAGTVVGWIAASDHLADAVHLRLTEVLERLLAKHPHVRVECVGVDLELSQRYRHDRSFDFSYLPARIAGFDVGIAPLADIPFNWARSDIKVKEYAASGVPWLASPVGPYIGLGEEQGGRLVSDDGWFEALDELVSSPRLRRRLSRKAKKWAKTQTIEASADTWERVFEDVVAAGRVAAGSPGRGP